MAWYSYVMAKLYPNVSLVFYTESKSVFFSLFFLFLFVGVVCFVLFYNKIFPPQRYAWQKVHDFRLVTLAEKAARRYS